MTATAPRFANETRVARNGLHVTRARIHGGGEWYVYSAWVPSSLCGNHSTIQRIYNDDTYYGRVGTDRLPVELNALPAMSKERMDAVHVWFEKLYGTAYQAILEAFPEAWKGTQRMGEIDFHDNASE